MPEQPAGAIRTLLVGTYRDAKFSLDGTKMYATSGNTVSVVDVASGSVVAQYDMGRAVGAFDLSADGRYLAVTANPTGTTAPQNSASFQRIDLTTGSIETFTFVTSKVDPASLIVSDFMDIVQLPGNRIMATTQQLGGGIIIIDLNGASPTITKIAASDASGYLEASSDHSQVLILGRGIHHYIDGMGITGSIPYDPYAGASFPSGIQPYREAALSPVSDLIILGGRPYNTTLSLQPASQGQPGIGNAASGFNVSGTRLFSVIDNLLAVYDTSNWQVVAAYALGTRATANLAENGSGGYAYSGFGDTLEISSDGRHVSLITPSGVIVVDLNTAVSIATTESDDLRGLRTQIGLGGDDQLGGADALYLYGGQGDDTYTILHDFSLIFEAANEGNDTALVNIASYTLPGNVENGTISLASGATLAGNQLDNLLYGGSGADLLWGLGGADTIYGNGDADRIEGGEGGDTLDGGDGTDLIFGNAGTDTIFGGAGNDSVSGGDDADTIFGGEGDDLLASSTLSNSNYSSSHDFNFTADVVSGDSGNDTVWVGYGDSADGGADTDTLYLSLNGAPSGLTLNTAILIGSTPGSIGGGTIVNFEVLGGLLGTQYADTITVSGTNGLVTLDTSYGNDTVYATDTSVNLQGGSGNDRFFSGSAADNFDGGNGINTLDYGQFNTGVTVTYNGYYNHSGIGPGGDTFSNVQILSGSNFDDVLTGGQLGDELQGNKGSDILIGSFGSDRLSGGDGNDTLYGHQLLTDFGQAYPENNILSGGNGDDTIYGAIGDTINGGSDHDTLYISFRPNAYLYAGIDADFRTAYIYTALTSISGIEHVAWIEGTYLDDVILLDNASGALAAAFGWLGNDSLIAGLWTGTLSGDEGNDVLNGTGSEHLIKLDGGVGDDRLIVGTNNADATIIGGSGLDTLVVMSSVASLATATGLEAIEFQSGANLTLTAAQFNTGMLATGTLSGTGTLTINMGPTDFDLALQNLAIAGGSNLSMTVNGSANANIIKTNVNTINTVNAGAGNDQIRGGLLADAINGGDGNDKITGYGGADILTGGAGNDQFRYLFASDSGTGANADRITDFLSGTDRLNFALLDADPLTAGRQALNYIGVGSFSATGVAQVRHGTSGANMLVLVDLDGDGDADMEIVLVGASGQTLTGGDFML